MVRHFLYAGIRRGEEIGMKNQAEPFVDRVETAAVDIVVLREAE